MAQLTYKEDIEKLRDAIYSSGGKLHRYDDFQYGLISANLYNFLPHLHTEKHEEVIKNIYFFQKWAVKDQYYFDLLTNQMIIDGSEPDWNAVKQRPAIFCSFHLGSYRLITPYLLKRGLKLTLLVDQKVAGQQNEIFYRVIQEVKEVNGLDDDCFKIFDTSNGNIIISLLREIRSGRSIMVLIDGNTGVDGKSTSDEKLAPIQLFNRTLRIRKGMSFPRNFVFQQVV